MSVEETTSDRISDACIVAPAKPLPTATSATPPRSGPPSTVMWYRRNRPKRIWPNRSEP